MAWLYHFNQIVTHGMEGFLETAVPLISGLAEIIGLFIIVQIVRNVQMLIPAYDFCIPEKECVTSSDNPCELFRRIEFPTNEFFPPRATDLGDGGRCCK